MKSRNVLFLVFALLFGFHNTYAQEALQVLNLKCNYQTEPLGIDAAQPSLSWQLTSGQHNVHQIAYRILISDNQSLLKSDKGNIWDSGKIRSNNSINILYQGKKLHSAGKYFWKVQIWDNKQLSTTSKIASWQMGLLFKEDWMGAKWIAYDEMPSSQISVPFKEGPSGSKKENIKTILPLLRKSFQVKKPLKNAVAYISGLGHFDMFLNGKKVGRNFLDAGWTNYDKYALYVSFDITKQLIQGNNAVGVMLGNGFYNIPRERYRKTSGTYGYPKMITRLLLQYTDGTSENIVSDASWKTSSGPVTFSSIYGGEDYDASLEQAGWDKPGFNDKHWKQAVIVSGPPQLKNQEAPPLQIMESFNPVKILQPKPGVWIYDLGQNASAIPQISVKGIRGKSIKITPAELLDSNSVANQKPSGKPSFFTYTLKGGETEIWHPQFTYYGFRYVQIEGAVPQGEANPEGLPALIDLKSLHVRNSSGTVGEFFCSNKLFNDIFKLIDWSVKSNMASVLTDCPHREKLGWLEVPHLLGNSVRYNYDIANFYKKIIDDMRASQTSDGLVPNIAPEWTQFSPDFRDSPEWGSSSVILPWYLYKWYGDSGVLNESYPMMQQYVKYLGSKAKNHIVSHGLGDWFDIGPNGSGSGYSINTPKGITGTAIYYYNLTILVETAKLLGKTEDAKIYSALAAEVRSAFNNTFFDKDKKYYGTGSQAANAMAVYMDLVEPQNRQAVMAQIISDIQSKNNRLTTGEVGYSYLIRVLESEGRSDLIYAMNNRSDVPGYGYQIAHGATTLMEDWEAKTALGNNHCMLGHLMGWFYSGLGGIRPAPNTIAFQKIEICPEVVGDITYSKASYQSPYGKIYSEWKKDGGLFQLTVEIPANTTADILLPAQQDSKISEGNAENENLASQATFRSFKNGRAVYSVGSGRYVFNVR